MQSQARPVRCALFLLGLIPAAASAADGVFVRFRQIEPADAPWFVRLGGFIHREPWHLPAAVWPSGADRNAEARIAPGEFSPWFDLGTHAGPRLHGRLDRAGGVAEFPNLTVDFAAGGDSPRRKVVAELATAPEAAAVVKRWEESFSGTLTSFLVSPNLAADGASLESAAEMTARRQAWAAEASGGKRIAPSNLWVQTSFWSPQRAELNEAEAGVLWQLGFNLVGNLAPEARTRHPFAEPGGHAWIEFAPGMTREQCEQAGAAAGRKARPGPGPTLFNFSDEIACRPPIGNNAQALAHFHAWLKEQKLDPAELGAAALDEVKPIEDPPALRERQKENRAAANRVFHWTTRFRQEAATRRLKWIGDAFRRAAPPEVRCSTLVADHPYFGGSGLGMGMQRENTTWGGYPLSLDWFALARDNVVDVMGVEDWMGINHMYGPAYTWEGCPLMGFQTAIFRSGSRDRLPVIAWITPSDEAPLRLKAFSALAQGAKHFFFWTYGPTATSTENYWSDLRGEYDGIVAVTRSLAAAESVLVPGRLRPTRVALLYALASDLWQPFGYVSMAERRLTYLSLVHGQHRVDLLTEQDLSEGRLADYDVLYAVDPNLPAETCATIRDWVKRGGKLHGAGGVGGRNEFDEEHDGLSAVFGIAARPSVQVQEGRFDLRGALNDLPWLDQVSPTNGPAFGALGLRVNLKAADAAVLAVFEDGSPAVVSNRFGKGSAVLFATCPGVSYAKDARFVPAALKEKWPDAQRDWINAAAGSRARPAVRLSHPGIEVGVYDAPRGTAIVLANHRHEPAPNLELEIIQPRPPSRVRTTGGDPLEFTAKKISGGGVSVAFRLSLGVSEIVLLE